MAGILFYGTNDSGEEDRSPSVGDVLDLSVCNGIACSGVFCHETMFMFVEFGVNTELVDSDSCDVSEQSDQCGIEIVVV